MQEVQSMLLQSLWQQWVSICQGARYPQEMGPVEVSSRQDDITLVVRSLQHVQELGFFMSDETTMESELGLSPSLTSSEIVDLFIDACGVEYIINPVREQKSGIVKCAPDAPHSLRRSARPHKTPDHAPGVLVGSEAKIDLRATRQVPNWAVSKAEA